MTCKMISAIKTWLIRRGNTIKLYLLLRIPENKTNETAWDIKEKKLVVYTVQWCIQLPPTWITRIVRSVGRQFLGRFG